MIRYSFLLILFVILVGPDAQARERQSRTLVLKNGLQVLLVHDPEVHRSAAALSVGVGHLYDPDEKKGLAHYLEHMLFLGTKKYPKVDSYREYLAENSGQSNAYTGGAITNYFFQVTHEGFSGALDRFSQFFKAPLFDEHYAEREVHAVSSEHDKNILVDHWRAHFAIKQISEEGHPIKKFGTGNKETLAGDNRPALLDFHLKYYAASKMTLAILSALSLKDQEELAEIHFSELPDHPVELPWIDPDYRKSLKGKFRMMKIKTIKDLRVLELKFPTIKLHDYLDSKPGSIVGSIIGHEGEGSLLSKLKEEGLALGLSAGGGYSHQNLSSFDVSIQLTEKGEQEYERVLGLFFSYIRMLRENGIEEYTFKEMQAMAQIDFDWKDPREGMGFVASKAALMQDYPLSDVETLPYLYREYTPKVYQAILKTLYPENLLVVLRARAVETDQVAPFYGTEYSIVEQAGAALEKLRNPWEIREFRYPKENKFIPYRLAFIDEEPVLIWNDDIARVWYRFDNRFKQPKVSLRLLIETPRVYETIEDYARARLYEAAVQEALNEGVYPIQLAGLSYHLGVEKKGVNLSVSGYSERILDLLQLVAQNLTEINIDEQKFHDLKDNMIRQIENRKLGQAYTRALYINRRIWRVKQYGEEELIEGLRSVNFQDLRRFAGKLYKKTFITGVIYGNLTAERGREGLTILLDQIKSKPLSEAKRYREIIEVLDPGDEVVFSHRVQDNNNALFYFLQVGGMDLQTKAKTSMIAAIIDSDFYTQMRTNQQLGYLVWSFDTRAEDRLYMGFIIQSGGYGPSELRKRVETWMVQTSKLFSELSDEAFEQYREGLIVTLEKKGDSIAEVSGNLYSLITVEKENFKFKKQLVETIRNLKKGDIVKAANEIFLDSQTARVIVLIHSKEDQEPDPEGVLSTIEEFKTR